MEAQTSPNAGLLIYQNALPLHNKNAGKAPMNATTINNTNKPNKKSNQTR